MITARAYITDEAVESFDHGMLWDTEIRGFGLRRSATTGLKTFFLKMRGIDKKERSITLGRFPLQLNAEQARTKAMEIMKEAWCDKDKVRRSERDIVAPWKGSERATIHHGSLHKYKKHLEQLEKNASDEYEANSVRLKLDIVDVMIEAIEFK